MEYYKCLASPNTSVKRCRNYRIHHYRTPFCSIHQKTKSKENKIQLYNGSICTFKDKSNTIHTLTPPIFLWKELNWEIARAGGKMKNKYYLKKLENQAKIIKCGSYSKVTTELIRNGIFISNDEISRFFQKKNYKRKHVLENIRHFLGVVYYFQRKILLLKKLQVNIRIKVKYSNKIDKITKIQKWFRYRLWLKKLPVKPIVMRTHYIPNERKIIIAQHQIKKYINIKIKHSHDCPFSLENYADIPNKYRVVYEYKEGNNKHWRYYHIKWLDHDWKVQTESKRYVIEPITKHEFPEEFVEKVARKVWKLSRIENDYNINNDERNVVPYLIEDDWIDRFSRRTLYRFIFMMLDLCNMLEIDIPNIKNWRTSFFKFKYQVFYLQVMPALKNIANDTQIYSLQDDIIYITRDLFQVDFIFPESEISDIASGDAIYGILRILRHAKRQSNEVYKIFRDVIKNNFKTLLM